MSLHIIDRLFDCSDGKERPIDLDDRRLLVFHRCGLGSDAEEIAGAYLEVPETGRQMPYTFVIRRDGVVEQALSLDDKGPHARRWNTSGIGVAVVGDFRIDEPTIMQWDAAIQLCSAFAGWATDGIAGHDELEGGSFDRDKECPGEFFDMDLLRDSVRDVAAKGLHEIGVVF